MAELGAEAAALKGQLQEATGAKEGLERRLALVEKQLVESKAEATSTKEAAQAAAAAAAETLEKSVATTVEKAKVGYYCGVEVRNDLTRCGAPQNSQTSSIWNWTGIEKGPRQLMRRGPFSIRISNRLFLIVLCEVPQRRAAPVDFEPNFEWIVFWPRLESTCKGKRFRMNRKFGIKSQEKSDLTSIQ